MSTKTKTKTTTVEGPTSVTRTTKTYSTKYNPVVSKRMTVIQRSSGGAPMGGSMIERSSQFGYHSMPSVGAGTYSNVAVKGVSSVEEHRANEKKDMQDLNERLGNYIEKVRFLEAQNKKQCDELERLKNKWGKETTAIKEMYETEIAEMRKLLQEAEDGKAKVEIELASLEEDLMSMNQRIEDLEQERDQYFDDKEEMIKKLGDAESEINQLRASNDNLVQQNGFQKREIDRLREQCKKLRADCDAESLNHVHEANRSQSLEEEIEFLKGVHDQELKELAALVCKDNTADNREFWKNEMGKALREITTAYDQKIDDVRNELESVYQMRLQEFRTGATKQNMEAVNSKEETKRLRSMLSDMRDKNNGLEADVSKIRAEYEGRLRDLEDDKKELQAENDQMRMQLVKLQSELEAVMKELNIIMDSKLTLELEIAAYRKLLEGEENRVGLRGIVEQILNQEDEKKSQAVEEKKPDDGALRVSQVVKGQMSAKTTYQRSAKGPVTIKDCASDGNAITLENTARSDFNLSNWKLKRVCDGAETLRFSFQRNTILPGQQTLTVYSSGADSSKFEDSDINIRQQNFGLGGEITTSLQNEKSEEKATHVQRTIYK